MSVPEIIPVATEKKEAGQLDLGHVTNSASGAFGHSLLINRKIVRKLLHQRELVEGE